MQHRYHINLTWSGEDQCWITDVPELTDRSAHGTSREEALRDVEVAMAAWL